MFGYDLGIDLGTSSIVISVVGKGVVLDEPSYVAFDTENEKVIYAGKRAYYLQGREPKGIEVIQPIVNGAVSNYSLACQMVRHFINKVLKKNIFRPRVVASIPSISTDVEKRILTSVIITAGAKSVCLIEESLCSVFGAGIDPLNPSGCFVINVGAGTTDMAVVSQGSISCNETLKTAGDSFDNAIVQYFEKEYDMLVGLHTAEDVKKSIGCAVPRDNDITMIAKGRDIKSGLPKAVEITGNEICALLSPQFEKIAATAKGLLEETSPQLVSDITNSSVLLTGGCAQIYGLDTLIKETLTVDVTVPARPNLLVSKGCEAALKKMKVLDKYGYTFKTKEEVRTR
ncbi:MAG: rod shape-determining protein [Clostridium sp.]|nr:rod shape-determining protein [Clostridium sp.]